MTDDRVHIQIQDGGTWRTLITTVNNSQIILIEMKNLKDRYPEKRVRAIDSDGRVVDIL